MKFKLYHLQNEEYLIEDEMNIEDIIDELNVIYFYESDYIEFTKENLWELLIDWQLLLIPIF